jgi:hypothetical protein
MRKFRKPALKAFEACPNKTFKSFKEFGLVTSLEVVCPQYPFGSKDVASQDPLMIDEPDRRNSIAMKLGCATCRFKDELFERVDTQRIAPDGVIEVNVNFIRCEQEARPHRD